jgi:hypothetical protein
VPTSRHGPSPICAAKVTVESGSPVVSATSLVRVATLSASGDVNVTVGAAASRGMALSALNATADSGGTVRVSLPSAFIEAVVP